MKRLTAFATLAGLGLVLAALAPSSATANAWEAEESGSSREPRLAESIEGNDPREIGFDIRDDIVRGQEFLRGRIAGSMVSVEKKRVVVVGRKGRKRERTVVQTALRPNFLLAIEDLRERKIVEVLVTAGGQVTDGFEVNMVRRNGVGSQFEIVHPENMVVLALKTTVRADKRNFKEVVYTPYSPQLDTSRLRQAGLSYLMGQIELAREDLERRKVSLPGFERLSTGMPTDVSLALSIIEHIDPLRFRNYPKGRERDLIHEVLTIIGANTVNAYAYSRSPAGAMGLFQIIPATYEKLQHKYPNAGLTKDFLKGCTDHVNAAKASLLLFDSDLSDLPDEHVPLMTKDPRSTGMYLAAAYNCGSKRVERSAKWCGTEWTCRLPLETRIYLAKFHTIWDSGITIDNK